MEKQNDILMSYIVYDPFAIIMDSVLIFNLSKIMQIEKEKYGFFKNKLKCYFCHYYTTDGHRSIIVYNEDPSIVIGTPVYPHHFGAEFFFVKITQIEGNYGVKFLEVADYY